MNEVNIVLCVTNDLTFDQRVLRTAASLKEMGAEVTLIGRNWPKGRGGDMKGFKTIRLNCWMNKGPLFYLEFNLRLLFKLLLSKADILVANDADTLLAVGLTSILRSKKWVFDSHEWFTEVPELKGKPLKRRIWHGLQRWLAPKADVRITVGPKLAVRLSNLFRSTFLPIRNLPLRLDIESVPEKESILLYQGALNEGRGLEALVTAMEKLPSWKLWLVGAGDIEDDIKKRVALLGLNEQVIMYGRVTPDILKDLTLKAKVGVNLLEGDSRNYYFSLANKFFDYAQCAVPVITMNFPEYRHLFESFSTGILIDQVEVNAIVDAVHQMENVEAYEEWQSTCLAAAKEWNWNLESNKLKELYRPLIQELKQL